MTTYYMGDFKTQKSLLVGRISKINGALMFRHIENGGDPNITPPGTIDMLAAIRTCAKRIQKFYGFTSKYDGKGNIRQVEGK